MKKPPAQLTKSLIQEKIDLQMQAAFRRVRDELGFGSDALLAQHLRLPTTYTHWLALTRSWPMDSITTLAQAANCHLDELLRVSNA